MGFALSKVRVIFHFRLSPRKILFGPHRGFLESHPHEFRLSAFEAFWGLGREIFLGQRNLGSMFSALLNVRIVVLVDVKLIFSVTFVLIAIGS